jgi:hypothetical protein
MVVIDPKMVTFLTDAREGNTAIDAVRLADPGNGFVEAKVCRTTEKVRLYQWETGQDAYDSFWFPCDPALGLPHNTSRVGVINPAGTQTHNVPSRVCAIIPAGTTVVVGARRLPNSPHDEMIDQWYVPDTKRGTRRRPPYGWRVELLA